MAVEQALPNPLETKTIVPVRVEITEPLTFVNLLKTVSALVVETPIYIDPVEKAILVRTLNLSEVSMIDAKFEPYSLEVKNDKYPFKFNITIHDFISLMPKLSKKTSDFLVITINESYLEAQIGETRFKLPVYDVSLVDHHNVKMLPLPNLRFTSEIHVLFTDFLEAVKRMRTISPSVTLSLEDKGPMYSDKKLCVSAKGEITESTMKITVCNYEKFDNEDKASYNLKYLLDILSTMKRFVDKYDWIGISFSKDYPMKISLQKPFVKIDYYQAPSMEKYD